MFVHCFGLCGHHAGTNEIASPLYRHNQRVRTRVLEMSGRLLPLSHNSRGLRGLRSMGSPRGQAALRLSSTTTPSGGTGPRHSTGSSQDRLRGLQNMMGIRTTGRSTEGLCMDL